MSVYDFSVRTADGGTRELRDYAGQALLIVNVASKCGLTPQYEGLEALYQDTRDRGLQVLGFPCNQFGGQEPGTDAEIQEFCSTSYRVTFPVFGKIDVNGDHADPLYAYLRGDDEIGWNFTKFLIDRDGNVARRYEPTVTPEQFRTDVEALLAS